MHNETEGKLTLRLIPTSNGPYIGLVYREDSWPDLTFKMMLHQDEKINIRSRQLAQDAGLDLYDHLCFLDFLDLCI